MAGPDRPGFTTGGRTIERARLRVTGTVQGVGFRPFVYRHAVALGLSGFVRNDSAGVLIEVQGTAPAIAELGRRLVDSPPPLARVATVSATALAAAPGEVGFAITESSGGGEADSPVSVDTATCEACLAEVDDPGDRRHGYPFTNCTNCGPRYTIVISVPYDRPSTTMAGFRMCAACQREYDDPADRRFHAQPNACPVCGPCLSFSDPRGRHRSDGTAALDAAVELLAAGGVVAVKGIGGFHLAVDATQPAAVSELRRRKARDDKPFAVMVTGLDMARDLVELGPIGEAALASPRRPIVLAARRAGAVTPVAPGVAPDLPELGVMLAYTPLHHLVMARLDRAMVLTSGNLSDDPIAYADDDAVARLGALVDGILSHDRPIHIRCDDSVVRVTARRAQVLRRSRGYAPEPLELPFSARRQVLAVGAELKSTVAVAKGRMVVASHHIGDLEHLATYTAFVEALDHQCALFGVVPDVVAHDLHPEYLSTKHVAELAGPTLAVQHHHAHVASCMVDNAHTGAVLGIAFDGLGLGTDATLWGGEFLVADFDGFVRAGHLVTVPLPGGTAAIREPWRMALAWARHSGGEDAARTMGTGMDRRWPTILALLEAPSTPLTSSMGRLFDAVAAIVVGRRRVSYEGQAAIELEALARRVPVGAAKPYPVDVGWVDGGVVIDPAPLVRAVIAAVGAGTPPAEVAARFHEGMGNATVIAATLIARARGLHVAALSGGVFQNVRLTDIVEGGLVAEGLSVLVHHHVPPNDGGISIGQAAIAAHDPHLAPPADGTG